MLLRFRLAVTPLFLWELCIPKTPSDLKTQGFRPVSGELLRGPILPANRAAKGSCLSLLERTW